MTTGCIYKITNTINNKIYIGKTVQKPQRRWYLHRYCAAKGDGGALYCAIRKYGDAVFTFEVIHGDVDYADLGKKEIECIKVFNCCANDKTGHGYNMTRGGDGGCSETSKAAQDAKVRCGTHHFQGLQGRQLQLDRIKAGTHNFTRENRKAYQSRVVRDLAKMSEAGTRMNINRVLDGTHPWLGGAHIAKMLLNGTHSSCKEYTCTHCGKTGKGGGMLRWHFDNCKEKVA